MPFCRGSAARKLARPGSFAILARLLPEGWPSGRRRTPGKCVDVNSVSRVRIPPPPPSCFASAGTDASQDKSYPEQTRSRMAPSEALAKEGLQRRLGLGSQVAHERRGDLAHPARRSYKTLQFSLAGPVLEGARFRPFSHANRTSEWPSSGRPSRPTRPFSWRLPVRSAGRSWAPAERLVAFEDPFAATVNDPALIAAVKGHQLTVEPSTKTEIIGAVCQIVQTPEGVMGELRQIFAK